MDETFAEQESGTAAGESDAGLDAFDRDWARFAGDLLSVVSVLQAKPGLPLLLSASRKAALADTLISLQSIGMDMAAFARGQALRGDLLDRAREDALRRGTELAGRLDEANARRAAHAAAHQDETRRLRDRIAELEAALARAGAAEAAKIKAASAKLEHSRGLVAELRAREERSRTLLVGLRAEQEAARKREHALAEDLAQEKAMVARLRETCDALAQEEKRAVRKIKAARETVAMLKDRERLLLAKADAVRAQEREARREELGRVVPKIDALRRVVAQLEADRTKLLEERGRDRSARAEAAQERKLLLDKIHATRATLRRVQDERLRAKDERRGEGGVAVSPGSLAEQLVASVASRSVPPVPRLPVPGEDRYAEALALLLDAGSEAPAAFRRLITDRIQAGSIVEAADLAAVAADRKWIDEDLRAWLPTIGHAAFTLARAGGPAEVPLADAFRAAVFDSANAKAWVILAQAAMATGAVDLAEATSLKAVVLGRDLPSTHEARAAHLAAAGRLEAAFLHLAAIAGIDGFGHAPLAAALRRCRPAIGRMGAEAEAATRGFLVDLARSGPRGTVTAALVANASLRRDDVTVGDMLAVAMTDASPPLRTAVSRSLPLVMISQIQRSGGTLLANLFDGHPELMVHPHEIQIGYPEKWTWPELDLAAPPEALLLRLFERNIPFLMEKGYVKPDGNAAALDERHPFDFSVEDLCKGFVRILGEEGRGSRRAVIDAYFSAYFSAWRNFEPSGRETAVLGFCPRLISSAESRAGLVADYPDGHVVCCVRDPVSWFASISRHSAEYADPEVALPYWIESTRGILAFEAARPGRVHVVVYEDLVRDTRRCMERLAAGLGIAMDEILLEPTYLRRPVMPNSSFTTAAYGVRPEAGDRRALVEPAVRDRIEACAAPLYREIVGRFGLDAGAPGALPAPAARRPAESHSG